ncbi:SDR family NAD(P)-dependent oxidoreductase [Streptomyces sp. NPDC090127]|uniref:SDR family NAD(P)-dependent oxidoreductase n=1 Tax=Streptomyces sp. NPDC090127 TaxID=3365953 RepID=UPI0038202110
MQRIPHVNATVVRAAAAVLSAAAPAAAPHPATRPDIAKRPVALITGAAGGIGFAIARELAVRGVHVALADIDSRAVTAAQRGDSRLAACRAVALDVTDRTAFTHAVDQAEEEWGPLDVLVNCAGIIPSGPFHTMAPESLDHLAAVNILGVINGCRTVVPRMLVRGRGRILNVSSLTALKPLSGLAAYSASKAAVLALSEGLRRELRDTGVRAQVLLPYLTNTRAGAGLVSLPGLKPLEPERIARTAVALLSSRRARACVPPGVGPLLAAQALLPVAVRDRIDDLLRCDRLAADPGHPRRVGYEALLAAAAPPPHRQEGR